MHIYRRVNDKTYFSKVLDALDSCGHGAEVRFGETGEGKHPNYQVYSQNGDIYPFLGVNHEPSKNSQVEFSNTNLSPRLKRKDVVQLLDSCRKSTTAEVAKPIDGTDLYQERARIAFPILVRQAETGQTIIYSSLAEEMGMRNPRNLNYVLGCIGQTIEGLNNKTRKEEKIPPIQCLVLNKNTGLPGEGISWFLTDKEIFSALPKNKKREVVKGELTRIFAYPYWNEVLNSIDLIPLNSINKSYNGSAKTGWGGGESLQHKRLKFFVANNPSLIKGWNNQRLPTNAKKGDVEFSLPSGDKVDVVFECGKKQLGVEVKSIISTEGDIVRGLYQCVKYQAVMEAVQASENKEKNAESVLILEGEFPKNLVSLKNLLGVTVFDKVKVV